MKFLLFYEGIPGGLVTPEQLLSLAKAQWAWYKRQQETGKAEVVYGLADYAGGLMDACGLCRYYQGISPGCSGSNQSVD